MNVSTTVFKLLFFKLSRNEMLKFNRMHFIIGLLGTWFVGIGRYWDDDKASVLQHLGLGSVIYIFCLALFIWILLKPFLIENWNYFRVVTFIALTSFPAIFYAIPVERFFSIQTANSINVWFLAIVALWRLALLFYFFRIYTGLNIANIITVTLMPICLIISILTVLNLNHVVFNLMGGIRDPNPHDSSYSILIVLTAVSVALTAPLVISYGIGIYFRRKKLKRNA